MHDIAAQRSAKAARDSYPDGSCHVVSVFDVSRNMSERTSPMMPQAS